MPDKITYYAIVDGRTTADRPYGLVRRVQYQDGGFADEGLRKDFSWSFTPAIVEWTRSKYDDELVEVTHQQASKIISYLWQQWGRTGGRRTPDGSA